MKINLKTTILSILASVFLTSCLQTEVTYDTPLCGTAPYSRPKWMDGIADGIYVHNNGLFKIKKTTNLGEYDFEILKQPSNSYGDLPTTGKARVCEDGVEKTVYIELPSSMAPDPHYGNHTGQYALFALTKSEDNKSFQIRNLIVNTQKMLNSNLEFRRLLHQTYYGGVFEFIIDNQTLKANLYHVGQVLELAPIDGNDLNKENLSTFSLKE